jgi:hypothetical protein
MDKYIALKKPKSKRVIKTNQIPTLTKAETITYLQHYFIPNGDLVYDEGVADMILREIKKKIDAYKRQDIKKDRLDSATLITVDECFSKLLGSKLSCYYCKGDLCILYDKVRQDDQWTLERIDNSIGHSGDNTVVACLECNLKRGTRSSKDFHFAKQLVIKKV